jgi:dipeptidyl aminopeptidase/acylaminoacyl peptidase
LYQIDSSDAPLFIAHSIDEFIPVAQAEVMIQALQDAGVTVESQLIPGRRHGVNYLDATMWRDIVEFLRGPL